MSQDKSGLVSKNEAIKKTLKETKVKRKNQTCFVRELKINTSHMNKTDLSKLNLYFIEAKWLYNALLASENYKDFDLSKKLTHVSGLDRIKNFELKPMTALSSQLKQSIQTQLQNNLSSLSKKKAKGFHIGKLKFVSEINSINLKQYKNTWSFNNDFKKISIQGIKSLLKVHGMKQFKFNEINYNFANAKLIKKASGFYLKVTYYINNVDLMVNNNQQKKSVGLDFGIKTNITTSDGDKFDISIKESESLKKHQRSLALCKKGSNNRYKIKNKIKKSYEKINNRKNDKANKIVSYLLNNYDTIYLQDENLSGWHKSTFGAAVQHSALGQIKTKIILSPKSKLIDKYARSTKECFCGSIIEIGLSRIFHCPLCGYKEDRDLKAAKFMVYLGENNISLVDKTTKSPLRIAGTITTD